MAAAAGLPVASKPDTQDLCFLAGTDRARFLARHGGPAPRPGAIVDQAGRCSADHAATTASPSVSAAESGSPRRRRCTCSTRTRHQPRRPWAPAAAADRGCASAPRACTGTARAWTGSKLALPLAARVRERWSGDPGPGTHRALSMHLDEPVLGAAPGQLACLMDGDVVIGWGTITRPVP